LKVTAIPDTLSVSYLSMATTTIKPDIETADVSGANLPVWPHAPAKDPGVNDVSRPSQRDALQALLAFSALHDQVRRRKALASQRNGFDSPTPPTEFEPTELFVLDEVLQLVAERAVAITGADGLAIALAENEEIVLRAAAGTVRPDPGTRIDRTSAFSGACFRTAQIINCDDTETDTRVNLEACRKMGVRSMVAVPLCGRRRVIGVLEAFSSWPFAFNEIDIRNLTLLAELVLGALKPEDEDRFAQSAQAAETKLESVKAEAAKPAPAKPEPPKAEPPKYEAKIAPAAVAPSPLPPKPVPAAPIATQPVIAAKVASPIPSTAPVVTPAAAAPAKPVLPPPAPKPAPAPPATAAAPVAVSKVPANPVAASASPLPAFLEAKPTATPEPALFGQLDGEKSQRPWMVFMLVGIVIATAFSVGVWWKLKTAQIGDQMVQNQPVAPSTQPNPDQSSEAAADSTAGEIPDSDQPENTPANPQDLLKFPHVTGVRHWSSGDSSTIVLDLEDQVQYEPGHLSNPERFYFDLRDTQLAAELKGKIFEGDSLLSHIRVAQPVSGMTRVVLEAKNSAALSAPQVSLEREPYRLVIQVSKAGSTPKTAVNLFPNAPEAEKSKLAIVVPPPTKEDLQMRSKVPKMRIVVDAGHGGWDLGTVGRRGLLEKDLVFEISQRLGKLLESRLGADVIYTRQDDNYIPLDERAVIANTAQADLFISVHANYSDTPSARGVETYYTNLFSAPGTKDLSNPAGPKEAAMRSTPHNVPTPTLTNGELHDRIEQSRRLASSVQRSLYGTLSVANPGLRDRGIKEAGFVVLTESAMPGILAEVSFVSSPTDEQKLRSDGYREQIAEALYKGIARYASSSKGVKVASAAK
jgi:N-acetylmuramoyl-L-alanine amidase/putative methionine-R-sulfoxide reductase with GAF domain